MYIDHNNDFQLCPHCGREFKNAYPSKSILRDWHHNAQLAAANYKKHTEACKKKATLPLSSKGQTSQKKPL